MLHRSDEPPAEPVFEAWPICVQIREPHLQAKVISRANKIIRIRSLHQSLVGIWRSR